MALWSGGPADGGDVAVRVVVGAEVGDEVIPDAVQRLGVVGQPGIDRRIPDAGAYGQPSGGQVPLVAAFDPGLAVR